MRQFTGLIFLGTRPYSTQRAKDLHTVLQRAIEQLGGIQQGCTAEEQAEVTEQLEESVRDIAAALLGREVFFGEELTYPPQGERPMPALTLLMRSELDAEAEEWRRIFRVKTRAIEDITAEDLKTRVR